MLELTGHLHKLDHFKLCLCTRAGAAGGETNATDWAAHDAVQQRTLTREVSVGALGSQATD